MDQQGFRPRHPMAFAVLVAAAVAGAASTHVAAAEAEPGRTVRAYERPAGDLWVDLLGLLDELGIISERIEAHERVLVSRFKPLTSFAGAGLSPPVLGAGLTPKSVQFHLFVPRLQKARVVVGAVVSGAPDTSRKRVYVYGSPEVESWLLDRLDLRLKAKGTPIGVDPTPDCDEGEGQQDAVKVSDVSPRYTGSGIVDLSYTIERDGTVRQIKVTGGDEPMRKAAAGAASLWRYRPGRLHGCTVPFASTARMTFRRAAEP